jgi:hypothetical protein
MATLSHEERTARGNKLVEAVSAFSRKYGGGGAAGGESREGAPPWVHALVDLLWDIFS